MGDSEAAASPVVNEPATPGSKEKTVAVDLLLRSYFNDLSFGFFFLQPAKSCWWTNEEFLRATPEQGQLPVQQVTELYCVICEKHATKLRYGSITKPYKLKGSDGFKKSLWDLHLKTDVHNNSVQASKLGATNVKVYETQSDKAMDDDKLSILITMRSILWCAKYVRGYTAFYYLFFF